MKNSNILVLQNIKDGLLEEPCGIALHQSCEICGEMFENKHSLLDYKEKDCIEEELEKDTSFVFNRTMLGKFL